MVKKLEFKDFLTVDYAPGMPDLIKRNAKKRKVDSGAGTNAEYSSRYAPGEKAHSIDENIGGLFKNASEWEKSAKDRGLVVKSMTHPSGKMTKYQIAKDKQGNNRGHFDHGTKSGRLEEKANTVDEAVPPGGRPLPALTSTQAHKWLDQGKHAKSLASKRGMGWETKMVTVKQLDDVKGKQHHIHAHQYTEETDLEEALTPAQRRMRARIMKRLAPRIALGRKRAERRFADPERLKRRAQKAARKAVLLKLTKDIPKDELTYARRQEIEKRLDSPQMKKRIERLAVKMLPKVRKKEIERKRGQQSAD